MFWNEEIETMSRPDLEELQLKKLQATVKRAFDKIPYYNKRYSESEVYPEDIETLKDIEKLPFITKDDLRESYPFGLFAVDIKDFNTKTLTEKYSYVISIASSLTSVVDKLQKKDVEGAKTEIINVLSKFVSTGDISKSADGLLDILKKQYNVPETVVPQVQSLTKPQ